MVWQYLHIIASLSYHLLYIYNTFSNIPDRPAFPVAFQVKDLTKAIYNFHVVYFS